MRILGKLIKIGESQRLIRTTLGSTNCQYQERSREYSCGSSGCEQTSQRMSRAASRAVGPMRRQTRGRPHFLPVRPALTRCLSPLPPRAPARRWGSFCRYALKYTSQQWPGRRGWGTKEHERGVSFAGSDITHTSHPAARGDHTHPGGRRHAPHGALPASREGVEAGFP